ncbi:MAG: glycosyltransferase family 4 protein [Microbacteriaceae bacterium]
MRVVIASRIFEPEPSAASFRLQALAERLVADGHEVEVKTVRPPAALAPAQVPKHYRVTRWPVKRDRQGYVRGYVSYMSFDVPLALRLLFSRRADAVVVEPPPTTGVMVRFACAIRRTPYFYYAADVWSDAAQQTGAPGWMVRSVRALEKWAWRGARAILSVSTGVTERVGELITHPRVATVGNGVSVARFVAGAAGETPLETPFFVYAGTASEWHGATAFVDAFAEAGPQLGDAQLVFIGGGSERAALEERAAQLGIASCLRFFETMPPEELAPWLAHSIASLASVRPGSGYDFAFPTKLYSSAACGAPLIYAGPGPAVEFVRSCVDDEPLGEAVAYDEAAIAEALVRAYDRRAMSTPETIVARRQAVSDWAVKTVSLDSVAAKIVRVIEGDQEPFSSGEQ